MDLALSSLSDCEVLTVIHFLTERNVSNVGDSTARVILKQDHRLALDKIFNNLIF